MICQEIKLDKNKKHNIDIVVDRLAVKEGIESRLTDSIETVLKLAEGLVKVDVIGGETMLFSDSFSCPDCGISIEEIEPRSFSFNNPFGACPCCTGLGFKTEFDIDLIIPDDSLTLNEVQSPYRAGSRVVIRRVMHMHASKHSQKNTNSLWMCRLRICRKRQSM